MSESESFPVNKLLAALPEAEYQRLAPHAERVELFSKQVLYEPNEPIEAVYFPTEGVVSLVSMLEDGAASEISSIGREGLVGFPAFLGGILTPSYAIVQISGSALVLDATILKQEFDKGGLLYRLLLLYTQALLARVSQTTACNSKHAIEQRLARWLLFASDCVERDELEVTQGAIAKMLGIRRSSVTVAASLLQQAGILQYRRGRIKISDRTALEARTCECYFLVKNEYFRLLGFTRL
ncbi:MAG: Crp/Fnr family transcriptional regulator [Cyanobacteriota bacterium]|nr:Crp/Fnr family transcriptional regulator [Cyanobacteriota bacterium]